jgi:hypothetical protein
MNFIEKYMKYAEPQTGAPRIYHYYMAYALLAQVIGKRATYHGAGGAKGTNLWFMVIGPSSMTYKSSVCKIGINLLTSAFPTEEIIKPHDGSYEAFMEDLELKGSGTIFQDELVNLMGWMERSYNAALMGTLTSLYDYGGETYRRKVGTRDKKRTFTITDPCLNIFTCSTIDWFNECMRDSKINGGFFHRFNIVKTDAPPKDVPRTVAPDNALKLDLIDELTKIAAMPLGPMDYSAEAGQIFDKWYMEWMAPRRNNATTMAAPMFARRATDCHKFAMIHAIMRGEKKTMNVDDIRDAIAIAKSLCDNGEKLLNDDIAFDVQTQKTNKALALIGKIAKEKGQASRGIIMRTGHFQARELDELIRTLSESNRIEIVSESTGGRPAVFYKLAKEAV